MKMVLRLTASALLTGGLALAAAPASAVSLGLTTTDAPVISGAADASNDFLGLSLFGDGAAVSTAPEAATGLLLNVAGADLGAPSGAFTVTGPISGASFLEGDLLDFGVITDEENSDTLELLFGDLGGSAAVSFGDQVLLELFGEFGDDPIRVGFGGFAGPVSATFTISGVQSTTVIPAPASLPLIITGVVALAAVRRRRNAVD